MIMMMLSFLQKSVFLGEINLDSVSASMQFVVCYCLFFVFRSCLSVQCYFVGMAKAETFGCPFELQTVERSHVLVRESS